MKKPWHVLRIRGVADATGRRKVHGLIIDCGPFAGGITRGMREGWVVGRSPSTPWGHLSWSVKWHPPRRG